MKTRKDILAEIGENLKQKTGQSHSCESLIKGEYEFRTDFVCQVSLVVNIYNGDAIYYVNVRVTDDCPTFDTCFEAYETAVDVYVMLFNMWELLNKKLKAITG